MRNMRFDETKRVEFAPKSFGFDFQLINTAPIGKKTWFPLIYRYVMRFPVISKESQKNRQFISTANSKNPKNEAKQKTAQKSAPSRKGVMRDVTCDSVIITRDLAV